MADGMEKVLSADTKYLQGLAGLQASQGVSDAGRKEAAPGQEEKAAAREQPAAAAEGAAEQAADAGAVPEEAADAGAVPEEARSRKQSVASVTEVFTMVDSDGGDSGGGDSDGDFGLSDRQLGEAWDKFQQGNADFDATSFLPTSFTGVVDASKDSLDGASFQMLSPSEAAEGSGSADGTPHSEEPRAKSSTLEVKGVKKPKAELPRKAGSKTSLTTIDDLPEAEADREHGSSANLRISMVSSRQIDRVTWYLWKVEEGNEVRLYMKRFNDFKKLDQDLRTKGKPEIKLLDLPTSGRFGLRHKLNIGDFNEKRKQGLERYIQQICLQIEGLSQEPLLRRFFGSRASGRVLPNV